MGHAGQTTHACINVQGKKVTGGELKEQGKRMAWSRTRETRDIKTGGDCAKVVAADSIGQKLSGPLLSEGR